MGRGLEGPFNPDVFDLVAGVVATGECEGAVFREAQLAVGQGGNAAAIRGNCRIRDDMANQIGNSRGNSDTDVCRKNRRNGRCVASAKLAVVGARADEQSPFAASALRTSPPTDPGRRHGSSNQQKVQQRVPSRAAASSFNTTACRHLIVVVIGVNTLKWFPLDENDRRLNGCRVSPMVRVCAGLSAVCPKGRRRASLRKRVNADGRTTPRHGV